MSDLHGTLRMMIKQLASGVLEETDVIPWASPVPAFGEPDSRVATLGLNPSRQEFVDRSRNPLRGNHRRLHTLESLSLRSWSQADDRHTRLILDACRFYFSNNPYDRWFRPLDNVLSGTGASYYDPSYSACHLDLVPFATKKAWSKLDDGQRARLLCMSGDMLGIILRDSSARVLILNGISVVKEFQSITGSCLEEEDVPEWKLERRKGNDVKGFAYKGAVSAICGMDLGREMTVLGFNHNIQGSFGMTNNITRSMGDWVVSQLSQRNCDLEES